MIEFKWHSLTLDSWVTYHHKNNPGIADRPYNYDLKITAPDSSETIYRAGYWDKTFLKTMTMWEILNGV